MRNLEIRPADMGDFKEFPEIFGEFNLTNSVGTPDPVKILEEEFEMDPRYQFVALLDQTLVGFVSCSLHERDALYIRHLMVSDPAFGRGLTGQMMKVVEEAMG